MVTLLILTNTILVFHFGQNQFSLGNFVDRLIEQFESSIETRGDLDMLPYKENSSDLSQNDLSHQPDERTKASLIREPALNDSDSYIYHEDLPQIGNSCARPVALQQQKNIYKWRDDNGITHLSDQPRKIYSDSPVTIVGHIKPEMVAINYLDINVSSAIQNKINARAMKAKEMFELVVPKSLIRSVEINFRLFDNKTSYESYRNRVAPSLGASLGFYRGSTNESVVMMSSENQGTNTAVHEAMHAINRHWFGNMSKWLNEGMAEYAETDRNVSLHHNNWFSNIQQKRLIPLSELFQVSRSEWDSKKYQMYATSWAYVAYLMDKQRPLLSRLLLQESAKGCDKMKLADIERVSGKSILLMQREFDIWAKSLTR